VTEVQIKQTIPIRNSKANSFKILITASSKKEKAGDNASPAPSKGSPAKAPLVLLFAPIATPAVVWAVSAGLTVGLAVLVQLADGEQTRTILVLAESQLGPTLGIVALHLKIFVFFFVF